MALSAERATKRYVGEAPAPVIVAHPMKAGAKIYKGSLVVLDAGYAKPGATATGLVAAGRAKKTVDNTSGNNGDKTIEVEQGVHLWDNSAGGDAVARANVGANCYVVDDQTVMITATGKSVAGTVYDVDSSGVWVFTSLFPSSTSLIALQKATVTITHGDAGMTASPDTNGTAAVINIDAALPANAVVIGHEVNVTTLFSGGGATAVKLDIGGTSTTAIVSQMDVFTGAATGALSPRTGAHAQGKFSSQQLVATITPDASHKTSGLTAGAITITVWYVVLA